MNKSERKMQTKGKKRERSIMEFNPKMTKKHSNNTKNG